MWIINKMNSENRKNETVWYVGYGSNLLRERFICYITGGQFRLGGSHTNGCKDKTLPIFIKGPISISSRTVL